MVVPLKVGYRAASEEASVVAELSSLRQPARPDPEGLKVADLVVAVLVAASEVVSMVLAVVAAVVSVVVAEAASVVVIGTETVLVVVLPGMHRPVLALTDATVIEASVVGMTAADAHLMTDRAAAVTVTVIATEADELEATWSLLAAVRVGIATVTATVMTGATTAASVGTMEAVTRIRERAAATKQTTDDDLVGIHGKSFLCLPPLPPLFA